MHQLGSLQATKIEKYKHLYQGMQALLANETDIIANLANFCSALKQEFNWWWIGFYIVKNDQLVLGPFQGPVACTRIAFGKGVCGHVWQTQQPVIVPDVHQFPGHIACSEASLSEIVLPLCYQENVIAVLDIDSNLINDFNQDDLEGLQKLLTLLTPHLEQLKRLSNF